MDREDAAIFSEVSKELGYARAKYGDTFDAKNTANDWVAYINIYLGRAVNWPPWDAARFRSSLIKVIGLCVSAIRSLDSGKMPSRFYDTFPRNSS